MKINEKSSKSHITVHNDIYIDKRFQNISKMVPKSSPKPSKMVGVELGKSTSSLNKALRELPRRLLKWTWPQNSPKIFPEDLQNPFKMTSQRYSRYDHPDVLVEYTYFEGNVNMSMDKPIALNSTEGTRDLQVKAAKLRSPGLGN